MDVQSQRRLPGNLRLLLLLLSTLLLGPSSVAATCYWANSTSAPDEPSSIATDDTACFPDQENSSCCGTGWSCLSNGVCYIEQNGNGYYYRGTCTDKTWGSQECPGFCFAQDSETSIPIGKCNRSDGSDWYCCPGDPDCSCSTGRNAVKLGSEPATTVTVIGASTFTETRSTVRPTTSSTEPSSSEAETTTSESSASSPLATSSTTDDATADSQSSPSPSSTSVSASESGSGSSSRGLAIGLGVGLGVAVAAVLALLFFLFFKRRRRQNRPPPDPVTNPNQPSPELQGTSYGPPRLEMPGGEQAAYRQNEKDKHSWRSTRSELGSEDQARFEMPGDVPVRGEQRHR